MNYARSAALTPGPPHVRDAVDLGWVMRTVLFALTPCVAWGVYNTGYQINRVLVDRGTVAPDGLREGLLAWLGAGRDPASVADCALRGAAHLLPSLVIALAAGDLCERWFASARRRPRTPGLAVTALLFTACLPPTVPWWLAALGMSFGVVVGREVFGGTGRNVFQPAVVGLAFLYLAYPGEMRGADVWAAVDGASTPDALAVALAGGADALAELGLSWTDAFLGRIPGALADTSKLGCLLGALYLVHQRVASWRLILAVLLGAAVSGALLPGPSWSWHLVLGNLAFGAVFLATDPVTSAQTQTGRWIYGLLIGFLVVLIRVANPAHTEGVLFAVLIGNTCAPLIDRGVIWLHVTKRRRRLARA